MKNSHFVYYLRLVTFARADVSEFLPSKEKLKSRLETVERRTQRFNCEATNDSEDDALASASRCTGKHLSELRQDCHLSKVDTGTLASFHAVSLVAPIKLMKYS